MNKIAYCQVPLPEDPNISSIMLHVGNRSTPFVEPIVEYGGSQCKYDSDFNPTLCATTGFSFSCSL
ncbi:hypothetical protein Hanom_Chr12g01087051 [Helianthus anomalus]